MIALIPNATAAAIVILTPVAAKAPMLTNTPSAADVRPIVSAIRVICNAIILLIAPAMPAPRAIVISISLKSIP